MIELVNGNSIAIPLASGSVHHIVTSPPYFGLRAYGAGDGEIGSEPTPDEFIAALVQVGRECWRVLRDDGVMALNLGDSYNGSGGAGGDYGPGGAKEGQPKFPGRNVHDLQVGDRMNIPHRVAAALQADGWLWRDTIIWQKLSAMPESVNGWRWERCRVKVRERKISQPAKIALGRTNIPNGRPSTEEVSVFVDCPGCEKCAATDGYILRRGSWRTTQAHEYIFVFAKAPGYFADREAVKVEAKYPNDDRGARQHARRDVKGANAISPGYGGPSPFANPRSVMTFKATPFKGAHYAAFPTTLPEWFIRAYTSEAGVCAECGAPWARVVESESSGGYRTPGSIIRPSPSDKRPVDHSSRAGETVTQTLGFRRTCAHNAPAVPATVLDPFAGSGSTLIAARQLGRSAIGLDLNLSYILDIARERLGLNAVAAWTNGTGKAGGDVAGLPMFRGDV